MLSSELANLFSGVKFPKSNGLQSNSAPNTDLLNAIMALPSVGGYDPTHHIFGALSDYTKQAQKQVKDQNSNPETKPLGQDQKNVDALSSIMKIVTQLSPGVNPGGNMPSSGQAPTGQPEPKPGAIQGFNGPLALSGSAPISSYVKSLFPGADSTVHAAIDQGMAAPAPEMVAGNQSYNASDNPVGAYQLPGPVAPATSGVGPTPPTGIHDVSSKTQQDAIDLQNQMNRPPPAPGHLTFGTKDLVGVLATILGSMSGPGGGAQAASSYLGGRQQQVDVANQYAQNSYQTNQQQLERQVQSKLGLADVQRGEETESARATEAKRQFDLEQAFKDKQLTQNGEVAREKIRSVAATRLAGLNDKSSNNLMKLMQTEPNTNQRYFMATTLQANNRQYFTHMDGTPFTPGEVMESVANVPPKVLETESITGLNKAKAGLDETKSDQINQLLPGQLKLQNARIDNYASLVKTRKINADDNTMKAIATVGNLKSLVKNRGISNDLAQQRIQATLAGISDTNLRTTYQSIGQQLNALQSDTTKMKYALLQKPDQNSPDAILLKTQLAKNQSDIAQLAQMYGDTKTALNAPVTVTKAATPPPDTSGKLDSNGFDGNGFNSAHNINVIATKLGRGPRNQSEYDVMSRAVNALNKGADPSQVKTRLIASLGK